MLCFCMVFWHLDVFRRSYRRLLGHTCMGNSCIFCALKVIFTQFQYSDKTSLHPDALRKALAETFANQQRFQLGHMDDAAECFENILRRIHFHIAKSQNEDACTAPHCLPHQKFSMAVYEKVVCPCGASSSPLKFSEMVHYVSASALVAQSRMMQENGDVLHPDRFGLLLRKASAMGDVRNCPAGCGKQVQKQRTLLNIPDVVSIGLVWDSDHPSIETTTEVAGALGTAILLQDMYHRVMQDVRILPRLQLVAVVCYYGKHYSTFVFHSKLRTWIYFDDATVREIGPQWENVVEKCSRGRFQPLLLLYANPSATPVSVDTAPRKRVMAPGYAPVPVVMPPEDSDSGLDRTQESIKSMAAPHNVRRSLTPSRDHMAAQDAAQSSSEASRGQRSVTPCADKAGSQETGRDSPARMSREHSRQPSFLIAVTGKTDKNKLGEGGENGAHLPGGASPFSGQHVNGREQKLGLSRQLMDGGAPNGRLETMPEDDYADYTLSSGDQYRRPSLNGFEAAQLPIPPNMGRYPDTQRKESFKRGNAKDGKGGADIVRYQVDPNRAPDFNSHGDGYSPKKNGGNGQGNVPAHPRQGLLSSARDEDIMVGSSDHSSSGQHVVVKPKPTGHGHHDVADGSTHTPVQSGLATLPRKKGQNLSDPALNERPGSSHQEVHKLTHGPSLGNLHFAEPPLPPGTPPPEYNSVSDPHHPHSRQTSTSSQASTIKASSSMGQIEQAKSESAHDLTDKSKYIDRRMVETILKHQGVHRQNSTASNNSVSSADSDSLMGKLLASKASGNLTVDIPYDNVSLGSHKDSGYGSSDRNSSSSTGSGTIDPYTQYFISKSMVVPRSVNQQALEQYQQYGKGPVDPYTGMVVGHVSQHAKDTSGLPHGEGRKIMHPIKESSQEDFLKMSPNDEPIGTQKFITAPPSTQGELRPPPVPPKNFAQFHVIKSSQPAHQRESSLDSLDKDENINERFVSLCKKADSLMDNCMLAETQEDIAAALCYCDSALGCLKEAMAQKDLNSKALTYVQKKHNSCLLKSRSLQKRMPARQESLQSSSSSDMPPSVGNRSSITSSDSDMSDNLAKQLRMEAARERQDVRNRGYTSQDSIGNLHDRQGSGTHLGAPNAGRQGQVMNGAPYSGGPRNSPSRSGQENGIAHQRTDSGVSRMSTSQSANCFQGGSSSGGDSSGSTADLYGTLPRNKSRKPSSETAASPEVYQSFLNKQKCLQAGVHASQQSLDSVKSDSGGSDHGSAAGNQQRMSNKEVDSIQSRTNSTDSTPRMRRHSTSSIHSDRQNPSAVHRQTSQSGRHQSSGFPPPLQTASVAPQPSQHSSQGAPPPVPSQKPVIPYPSSIAKSRAPNGQGPAVPTRADQAEMRHAASSMHLSGLVPGSKPLERCASQPDCQKLVDSAYPANQPDAPSSVYGDRDKLRVSPVPLPQPQPERMHGALEGRPESRMSPVNGDAVTNGSASSELPSPSAVSVRALASRFENSDSVPAPSAGLRQCTSRQNVQPDDAQKPHGHTSVQRTRSKSESFSRKPKSVLKNKKNKTRQQRKSVTFGDSITHYTDCDEPNSGYESARELSTPRVAADDRAYYSDDEERLGSHVSYSDNELDDVEDNNSSNSDDSPVGDEEACQLCHKRRTDLGKLFCAKCSFYMSRLKSN
ncbi:hypothetical protein BaRGS_00007803 [Batillaria attramentaria]|uniref:USP domain-containing protein n=1 Tax=Batillaria attramentaria TaxID=370345 RepID=A0ABD0LNZ6_9CAEN